MANINSLISDLKTLGYANVQKDSASRVIVFVENERGKDNRKNELKLISEILKGRYLSQKSGSGWRSSVGAVSVDNFIIIAKPESKSGSGNLATLDARVFSSLGKKEKFNYNDQEIDVVTFTSSDKIEKSIVDGCKTSRLLGKDISLAFEEFFTSKKINWSPETQASVISKLGVYVGEVLVGWVFLKNKQQEYFSSNPFKGKPKKFILPTDPAFSGVDSFIMMTDNSYYSLSSKLDEGAAASLFSNLLKIGIEKETSLKKSVFKDLCKVAKENALTYKKSREIVYTYGIENILGFKKNNLNVNDVYNQIITGKLGVEAKQVIASILKYKNLEDIIKTHIATGASISGFFNREIAKRLNEDDESIKQMLNILQGKDYWQGNLDKKEWLIGKVKYDWLSSAKTDLKIIGNKSAVNDPTSKQGWINYRMQNQEN